MALSNTKKFEGQTTIDIPDKLKFDVSALQSYMEASVAGFRGQLSARKFGLGQSNPTFLLSTDQGQKYVMRKQPAGRLIKGAHAVDREARIITVLGTTGFPVPSVYKLCTDTAVLGSMFYIMSFKGGRIFDNALDTAPVSARRPMLLTIVRTLAQLHTTDIDAVGMGDYGRRHGFYERQIKTLSRITHAQVEGGSGRVIAIPRLAELLAWFKANLPRDVCTLVHGDYKPDNVVFDKDSNTVIAVLDWELSTLGHPLSDLANSCLPYYFQHGNALYPSFHAKQGGLKEGIPSEEAVLRAYCESSGTPFPIPQWHFFIAFAFFRLSVIIQGVAMRTTKGVASHATAFPPEVLGAIFELFSKMWWGVINKNGGGGGSGSKL